MVCRCLSVLCILLMCMLFETNSSPLGQRSSLAFSQSLRLTRTIRARVQQLLSRYKKQLFDDELFEHRELMLHSLPVVTVSYQTWLQMQDIERLRLASHHLQNFWTHLEFQRQQLEQEKDDKKSELRRDKRGRPQVTLCQSFMGLQIDLRDLMKQVNFQLQSLVSKHDLDSTFAKSPLPSSSSYSITTSSPSSSKTQLTSSYTDVPKRSTHFTAKSTQTSTASNTKLSTTTAKTSVSVTVTPRPTKPTQTSTVLHPGGSQLYVEQQQTAESSRWIQHLKGYIILRDLERYLSRLARDYTALQAKTKNKSSE